MPIDRDGDGPPLRREDAKPSAPRPDDLRATAFTDDVFDDDYYGRRKSRTGAFGLIAGVVVGAAVAAAAGWYVFGTREPSTADGTAVSNGVVHADPNPYKVKPEDPGGLQVENQDKLVYERLDKSAKPNNRVENLLPEPEQPKAPPLKKPDAPPGVQPAQPTAVASNSEDPLAKLVAKLEGVKNPPPAPEIPPQASEAPPAALAAISAPAPVASAPDKPMTPLTPLPAPPSTPAAADAAASTQTVPRAETAPPTEVAAAPPAPAAATPAATSAPTVATPIPTAPAAPPPAPLVPAAAAPTVVADAPQAAPAAVPAPRTEAPTPAVAGPGAMFLQLASARSEDAALGEWKRISAKNGDLLGNLTPSVVQADLGDKGTFFRLRAGPVVDKATAEGLCASLASRNVGCIVVRP